MSAEEPFNPQISQQTQRTSRALLAVALVAALLLIYGQIVQHDFVAWDDDQHILENPFLQPVSLRQTLHFWQQPYFGLYIPVSYTVFALETALGRMLSGQSSGFDPRVFHAGSLVLHLTNVLLVMLLLRRLVKNAAGAFAGALLFGLHPVQVESVAWISETRGLLSAFWSLIAIHLYYGRCRAATLSSAATPGDAAITEVFRGANRVVYVLATLSFLLALLAKPTAVALPLMIAVIDVLILRRRLAATALAMLPWLCIAAGVVVISKSLQSDDSINVVTAVWQRPLIAGDALMFYLSKILVPLQISFDYGRSPAAVMNSKIAYVAWLLPAVLIGAVVWVRRLQPYRSAVGVFVVALLPVLGLIPFAHQEISTVADRYLYLPMIGAALAMAVFLAGRPNAVRMCVVTVVIAVFATIAFRQAQYWQNSQVLFRHALKVNPDSFVTCNNYGNVCLQNDQVEQAIQLFRTALRVKPDYARAHYGLGVALIRSGNQRQALHHLQESIRIDPSSSRAHYDLAVLLSEQEDIGAATQHYTTAISIDPANAAAHNNLGLILFEQRQMAAARSHFETAIRSAPEFVDPRVNLGNLLIVNAEGSLAIEAYHAALRLEPNLTQVQANIGRYWLQQGQLEQAAKHLHAARDLSPDDADIHFDLGLVYSAQERISNALQAYQAAIQHAPQHARAHLNLGILLYRDQQTDLAEHHLQLAATHDRKQAMAHNMLGVLRMDAGRTDDAIDALEQAIACDPQLAAAHYHLGRALYRQGKIPAAMDRLQQALKLVSPSSAAAQDIQQTLNEYQSQLATGGDTNR